MRQAKNFRTALLAIVFVGMPLLTTGCYTKLATDQGDYWGYTGHARRQARVAQPEVVSDTIYAKDPSQPDTIVVDDGRTRSDAGYASGSDETIINNYYNTPSDPWYDYYPYPPYRPAVNFSISFGYGRGWGGWGGYEPYPDRPYGFYDTWYDPVWSYGYPVWPYYGYGSPYYGGWGYGGWGGRRGYDGDDWGRNYGNNNGYGNSGNSNPNHRVGRIMGGESQTGGRSNPSSTTGNGGRVMPSTNGNVSNSGSRMNAPSQPSTVGGSQQPIRNDNNPPTNIGRTSSPTGAITNSPQPNGGSQRVAAPSNGGATSNPSQPVNSRPEPTSTTAPANTSQPSNAAPANTTTPAPAQRATPKPSSEMNRGIPQSQLAQNSSGRQVVIVHRNSGGNGYSPANGNSGGNGRANYGGNSGGNVVGRGGGQGRSNAGGWNRAAGRSGGFSGRGSQSGGSQSGSRGGGGGASSRGSSGGGSSSGGSSGGGKGQSGNGGGRAR